MLASIVSPVTMLAAVTDSTPELASYVALVMAGVAGSLCVASNISVAEPVATVEPGADQAVFEVGGHRGYELAFDAVGRIACINRFAMGAATAPPKPLS